VLFTVMIAALAATVEVSSAADARIVRRLARTHDAVASVTLGQLTYVASGERGLQIVEEAGTPGETLLGRVAFAGDASDVKVVGGYAYVAAGGAGLQVVDVSNSQTPFIVGACTSIYAAALEVVGHRVYVASENQGVSVVDITDPTDPALVHVIITQGSANGVALADGKLIIADSDAGAVAVELDR